MKKYERGAMIISRTPLRVSFAGGGTDLPSFYLLEPGSVVNTAINKYIYITVNKRFDDTIRISYSKTEIVDNIEKIEHPVVREALRLLGVTNGIEITSISDVPSKGTGLGSSSSFTVGLLNALHAYKGEYKSAETLAREACKIEREILKEPGGKQDQYIAAYGGLQFIEFHPDESVFVNPVICSKSTKKELEKNLIMFFTGVTRDSTTIHRQQEKNTIAKIDFLRRMKILSEEVRECLMNNNVDKIGKILHENWILKKQLADGISDPMIDALYEKGIKAGALGGKILGAGGGGFLLFYSHEENHDAIREALKLRELQFRFEQSGSKIIFIEENE